MKLSTIKSIEIFSDGTFHFSYVSLKSMKQVVFYEKNIRQIMNIKELDNKYVLPTYARADVEFVSGNNARLVDSDGKKYIDFTSNCLHNSISFCLLSSINRCIIQSLTKYTT